MGNEIARIDSVVEGEYLGTETPVKARPGLQASEIRLRPRAIEQEPEDQERRVKGERAPLPLTPWDQLGMRARQEWDAGDYDKARKTDIAARDAHAISINRQRTAGVMLAVGMGARQGIAPPVGVLWSDIPTYLPINELSSSCFEAITNAVAEVMSRGKRVTRVQVSKAANPPLQRVIAKWYYDHKRVPEARRDPDFALANFNFGSGPVPIIVNVDLADDFYLDIA